VILWRQVELARSHPAGRSRPERRVWIQSCRHELLDRTLVWNQRHLLHVLHEYERHPDRAGSLIHEQIDVHDFQPLLGAIWKLAGVSVHKALHPVRYQL